MKPISDIARVFPHRTNMTPTDKDCYIGQPFFPEFMPKYKEVHISVTFTWNIQDGKELKKSWERYFDNVKIGGPAFNSKQDEFTPGMYLKEGVTITSRGCPYHCDFCMVSSREGFIKELEVKPGNIIQDNNILACSKKHIEKVFTMLRKQKAIEFKGGLDKRLIKDWHVEWLRTLKIKELWFALDNWNHKKQFVNAIEKCKRAGFTRNQLRCYVLAGQNEPIQASEGRLKFVYETGCLPYIQVYQEPNNNKRFAGENSREDNLFVRDWSRPAIIKAMMKEIFTQ